VSELRTFEVTKPEFTDEDVLYIPTVHHGKYLELFYNLVLQNDGLRLPDHLRPVAWAIGDKSISKLMVVISPGSGKSQMLDIVVPVWELGLDPAQQILSVSAAEGLMTTFLKAAMNIIEHSKLYHQLFPRTKPDRGMGWSAYTGMYVERGQSGIAPPSYSAAGVQSKTLIGKHAKIIIGDDLHDYSNSLTQDQIDKLEDWYYRTLLGRQDPQGCRLMIVCRRWDADDLYGRLLKSGDWLVMELPSIREGNELYYDVTIPAHYPCIFNNNEVLPKVEKMRVVYGHDAQDWKPIGSNKEAFYWPGVIAKYREAVEARKNKPAMFEIVYQSRPERAGMRLFNPDDFRYYNPPYDVDFGLNSAEVSEFISQFDFIIQSWDTAFTASTTSDNSVCYCVGLKQCHESHSNLPAGLEKLEIPYHYDIYVLSEFCAKLDFGDLTNAAITQYNNWEPSWVLLEKTASGLPLVQELIKYSIPIEPIVVQGTSKRGRAINGAKAGSAQGWFKQHRVLFPADTEWVKALETELKEFTGMGRKETDDRVDALVQAINYAIDLGIKLRELPDGWRNDTDIDARIKKWFAPANHLQQISKMTEQAENPFYGTCSTCVSFKENFCNLHKIVVSALHSCSFFAPARGEQKFIRLLNDELDKTTKGD
jgi:predicted phage terminase large subunit-like protein